MSDLVNDSAEVLFFVFFFVSRPRDRSRAPGSATLPRPPFDDRIKSPKLSDARKMQIDEPPDYERVDWYRN